MRLKQGFNAEMLRAVREYHIAQRDRHVTPVRWVCDPEGYALLLVRFEDEQGRKVSSLMSCSPAYSPYDGWTVDEVTTCPREDEHSIVQVQMLYSGGEVGWEADAPDEKEEDKDEHRYIGD